MKMAVTLFLKETGNWKDVNNFSGKLKTGIHLNDFRLLIFLKKDGDFLSLSAPLLIL